MKPGKRTATRSGGSKGLADPKGAGSLRSDKRRVAVVDDHPMTRAGLVAFINGQSDLEVCFEADSPVKALVLLADAAPDIIVTDLTMPGRGGIEFVKDLHTARPAVPILVLSMHDEMLFADRVMRAGAKGYLMKDAGGSKVIQAVRRLLDGGFHVSAKVSSPPKDSSGIPTAHQTGTPEERLSNREFQVFWRIGEGKTVKEIAVILGLSPKTVDVHRGHIKEKLGLVDATSLFHYAVRWIESRSGSSQ